MTRRVISLGLCLGLLALGPAALSVCAMTMSLPAECAQPAAQESCDGMLHAEEPVAVAAGDGSCCRLSGPVPDGVALTKATLLPQLSASPVVAVTVVELSQREAPVSRFADSSASPAGSLEPARLCVFLI
jgi:hypothetical protein